MIRQSFSEVVRKRIAAIAFATAVAGYSIWYLFDAIDASTNVQNLIFVLPLVVVIVASWAGIVASEAVLRRSPGDHAAEQIGDRDARLIKLKKTAAVVFTLGIYTIFAEEIGFDIATFLFLVSALVILGERNFLVVLAFSAVFALAVVAGFAELLSIPVPTVLF